MRDPLLLADIGFSSHFARHDGLAPVASQDLGSTRTEAGATTASTIQGWERAVQMSRKKRDHKWSNWLDLDGLAAFLRERHPEKTAEHVASLTDTPIHTVRKWLARMARPGCSAMLRLVCVYGPDVLKAMFHVAPDWLDAAVRDQDQARAEARVAALKRQQRGAA